MRVKFLTIGAHGTCSSEELGRSGFGPAQGSSFPCEKPLIFFKEGAGSPDSAVNECGQITAMASYSKSFQTHRMDFIVYFFFQSGINAFQKPFIIQPVELQFSMCLYCAGLCLGLQCVYLWGVLSTMKKNIKMSIEIFLRFYFCCCC